MAIIESLPQKADEPVYDWQIKQVKDTLAKVPSGEMPTFSFDQIKADIDARRNKRKAG